MLSAVLAAVGVVQEVREHRSAAQWYADWFRGGLRGPYGESPRTLPGGLPVRGVRRAAVTFARPGGIGAEVSVARQDNDLVVTNLATGRTFWRRHRAGLFPRRMTVTSDGRLVLTQWSDGQGVGLVEAVDLHTGSDRWRFDPQKGPEEGHGLTEIADPVEAGPSMLVFAGYLGAVAVSRTDGRVLWTTRWPHLCNDISYETTPSAAGGAVVVDTVCTEYTPTTGHEVHYLVGFDLTTGAQRWKVRVDGLLTRLHETGSDLRPIVAGVGSRVAVAFGRGSVLLDGQSGQVVGHTPLTDWSGGTSQDTIRLGHCPAKEVTAVCACDTNTGHTSWTATPPPESFLLPGIGTYAGRVYVLLSPSSGPTRLGILDQHTGTWQAQLPLPGTTTHDQPTLYKVTGSSVVIGPSGGPYTVLTNKDT
ncbi:MAG: PQQ-like protein [Actinomycetia bacterium]|nr:PQQ-like protein [Actinomycetes bacterium]